MNDETFLSNDGKKFGGDALSYHMLLSDGVPSSVPHWAYKAITRCDFRTVSAFEEGTAGECGFSAQPNC
jgi:hypothetical protein